MVTFVPTLFQLVNDSSKVVLVKFFVAFIDSVLRVITLLAQGNLGPAVQFDVKLKTLNGK